MLKDVFHEIYGHFLLILGPQNLGLLDLVEGTRRFGMKIQKQDAYPNLQLCRSEFQFQNDIAYCIYLLLQLIESASNWSEICGHFSICCNECSTIGFGK